MGQVVIEGPGAEQEAGHAERQEDKAEDGQYRPVGAIGVHHFSFVEIRTASRGGWRNSRASRRRCAAWVMVSRIDEATDGSRAAVCVPTRIRRRPTATAVC